VEHVFMSDAVDARSAARERKSQDDCAPKRHVSLDPIHPGLRHVGIREGEWCGYMGWWLGWAGRRSSSALTIGKLSAAHVNAICSTILPSCTRVAVVLPRSLTISGLQGRARLLSKSGGFMGSDGENQILHRTMEPDLNGRHRCGLQPRNNIMSDTNREEISDFGHVGLDLKP
jgi:hypothetical protein